MRSLRPLAASGLSNLPDNPTPLPDDGPPLSSGYREHRRILYTEPDDNKRLTYAGYSGYRRVRRVLWGHGSHQQEVEECTLHRECFVTTFCAVITPSLRVKSRNGEGGSHVREHVALKMTCAPLCHWAPGSSPDTALLMLLWSSETIRRAPERPGRGSPAQKRGVGRPFSGPATSTARISLKPSSSTSTQATSAMLVTLAPHLTFR